ncbi:MAG: NAD(P)/FAD-dependent oxidoreductase [Bacillota bacterium]
MERADVIVVGGGVIGTAIAYRLVERGLDVLLLDRGGIASGTSGACDQAILLQSKKPGLHLQLARASADLYRELESELEADIEYERHGGMIIIETEQHLRVMSAFVEQQRQAGLQVRLISAEEAHQRQVGLAPHIVGATWSDEDAQVNPLLLSLAFARAARRRGGRIRTGVTVTGLTLEGDRVTGVQTDQGPVASDWVVLAAGPLSPQLAGTVGCELPIKPRRGQLIVTEPMPPMVCGDILCARYIASKLDPSLAANTEDPVARYGVGLSLAQTASGNLLIGGSREFAGYDRATTPEVIQAILRHALRIVPALASVRAIRTMAGLRPFTPDSLPIIGKDPHRPGLVIAAGHEGDGIALSPITGAIVADLITGGPRAALAASLGPERFWQTAQ